MITREQRYGFYIGVVAGFLIGVFMLLSTGCSAMTLTTHRVEPDGTVVDVNLKSKREYANFELKYNPETKQLEITATEVKTGPDAWAPVVDKLIDRLPNPPN